MGNTSEQGSFDFVFFLGQLLLIESQLGICESLAMTLDSDSLGSGNTSEQYPHYWCRHEWCVFRLLGWLVKGHYLPLPQRLMWLSTNGRILSLVIFSGMLFTVYYYRDIIISIM